MTDSLASNRSTWDHWARINYRSEFYGVEELKAGRSVRPGLDRLEAQLLGEVAGKALLHLMCHFGIDTLTQARRGARVTGVDFSPEAIRKAHRLTAELGLEAQFIESDVYQLETKLDRQFDLVFTSIGVLSWLPDLASWACLVERFLLPGGRFVLLEAHPTALIFDDQAAPGELSARYPYFGGQEPLRFEQTGCYTAPDDSQRWVLDEWQHSLSEILGSILAAGLRIESFDEYDYIGWKLLPWMVEREDRCFELPDQSDRVPLMFSLVAHKPKASEAAAGDKAGDKAGDAP